MGVVTGVLVQLAETGMEFTCVIAVVYVNWMCSDVAFAISVSRSVRSLRKVNIK